MSIACSRQFGRVAGGVFSLLFDGGSGVVVGVWGRCGRPDRSGGPGTPAGPSVGAGVVVGGAGTAWSGVVSCGLLAAALGVVVGGVVVAGSVVGVPIGAEPARSRSGAVGAAPVLVP